MKTNNTKYRKSTGFTLIELLAVIVILAIIALIATPIILGIVNDARKDSFQRSVELLVSGTDIDVASKFVQGSYTYTIEDGDMPEMDTVTVQNTKGMNGYILYTDEGDTEYVVHNNKWCVIKTTDTSKATISDYDETTCKGYYREEILKGADPVLKDNLVPVKIGTDGVITKADRKERWYSYADKEWANAVTLVGKDNYEIGATIPETDIKQYYVWIPRYKYELWNVESADATYPNGTSVPSAINIEFESRGVEVSSGSKNGEYLTHPAFTAFNTNGLWVGKFETSYDDTSLTDSSKFGSNPTAYNAVATDIESGIAGSKVLIKPNIRSLTNIKPSQMYQIGRAINPTLQSHIMKNMEWGAVAYLTYSLYGKCTKESCEEVYINNVNTGWLGTTNPEPEVWAYSTTITGCSADSVSALVSPNQTSCAIAWNETSNKASTTGNTHGIYDMSGGTSEHMMSVVTDENGTPYSGKHNLWNSGFKGPFGYPGEDSSSASILELDVGVDFPKSDTAYYDVYYNGAVKTDNWNVYENGRLGDATKEVAPNNNPGDRSLWSQDYAYFATPANPWFDRGGYCDGGAGAGVMNFERSYGNVSGSVTFRVVLAA